MDDGEISEVNLKCNTRLIGSFRMELSIFPGLRLSKTHLLSVALNVTVKADKIHFPVDLRVMN